MLEISQEISRNFTPCFSSPATEPDEKIRLSPRELWDIGEEIGRDFAPKPSCHIPELMLLPVDPGHLYACWYLAGDREVSTQDNDQLTLRIYSQSDDEEASAETVSWFDVAIDNPMNQQQVSLPSPVNETAYSAAIGKWGADDGFIAIAQSNIIHAPLRTAWHQDHQDFSYCQGKNASGLGINKQV
ncbi:MAG: DUF4912 domain-containing protein [Methylobacter sp.]|nr:DUF4912 domain-containing protein [Methylobacter sp.]